MSGVPLVRRWMRSAEDTEARLADALARMAEVAAWHVPGKGGGRGGRHKLLCTECGFPYPCRTVQRLEITT